MKKIIFLDTETTGNEPKDFLCQLAYKTAASADSGEPSLIFNELFKPPIPIPPEASAVTHITNKMVADKPVFKESDSYKNVKSLLEDPQTILVAHNAKFDIGMIAKEGIIPTSFICTLRVARALDTESKIPQYKLQYLRYFLDIEIDAQAHDAMGDVLVLEKLFERLLEKVKRQTDGDEAAALERMIQISSTPSLLKSFTFGKHSGKTVAEIATQDRNYLEWLLSQKETQNPDDEDWIYTLKYYLGKLY
jgi:DNA polymerase III epsilon subunit-like protein